MSELTVTPVPGGAYVVSLGAQGPQGPAGPAGADGPAGPIGPVGPEGGTAIKRPANGAIGGQRVVVGNADGTVSYADATDTSHLGRVLGVTQTAVSDGEDATVIHTGYFNEPTWSWDTSLPLYAGANGLITQTTPAVGFSQIIGFAETPTRIYIRLREPIAII